jgi:hypothetical protein
LLDATGFGLIFWSSWLYRFSEFLRIGNYCVCVSDAGYGIVAIHDIPYNIAKARNHPHRDAIHAAGWVSLFTLHAIWPFLWIWATIYRPERGYGFSSSEPAKAPAAAESPTEKTKAL